MRKIHSIAAMLAALITVASACDDDGGGGSTAPAVPARVVAASPQALAGTAGAAVATAPAVRVSDEDGRPLAGVPVTFQVASGGGTLAGASAATDANGVAAAQGWTLGREAGPNVVVATVAGLEPVSFTATARPGAVAALTAAGGDGQLGAAGTALADSITVRATDALGNPVPGVVVTFAVTGGGSLSGSRVTTSEQGTARVRLTLGRQAGTATVTATAEGAPPVTFTARAAAGPAASIVPQAGDDQSAAAGAALPVRPAVRVVDAAGNPVAGAAVTFAVTRGGGRITGGSTSTDSMGIATVGGWILGTAGPNALTATVQGLLPATFSATALDPCAASAAYTFGGTATGELGALDCALPGGQRIDFLSFTLTAAKSMSIDQTGTGNPFLYLFDAAGRLLAFDDDGAGSRNARIRITLRAGSYFIGASTGTATSGGPVVPITYTVTTREEAVNAVGCVQPWLVPGSAVSQELTTADSCYFSFSLYADRFQLQLEAGQRVTVGFSSASFDTYLRVFGPSGEFYSDDDSGEGSNSLLTFTAPSRGRYIIEANPWGFSATGAYTLTID